eukprot:scaffold55705_cov20-Tisochrysis_lutea.AAC.3
MMSESRYTTETRRCEFTFLVPPRPPLVSCFEKAICGAGASKGRGHVMSLFTYDTLSSPCPPGSPLVSCFERATCSAGTAKRRGMVKGGPLDA